MKRNDIFSSPHLVESKLKRKKAFIRKVSITLGLAIVLLAGLGLLSRIKKINIESIKVEGNKVAETKTLENAAWDVVSGKYLWLFPKTNVLFYPKSKIEKHLKEEFKILKSLSISIEKDRSLKIALTERAPEYVWCGEDLTDVESKECYFLDETGYVFSKALYFSGDLYFRFFGELEGKEVLGSRYLPEEFGVMTALVKNLKQMGLKPFALLNRGKKLELYLSSTHLPPNSPKIILDRGFDLEKVVTNLESILATEPLQSNFKTKYATLEYIDLSFGNKVYYRFK